MKVLKKLKWFLLIGYLLLAALWALSIGFNRNELLAYDGNKFYDNIIINISDSYMTETGELVLCLSGYLSDSKKYRVNKSNYSVSFPIVEIWNNSSYKNNGVKIENSESIGMYLTEKAFGNQCDFPENYKVVPTIDVDLTKKELTSFNEYEYVENMELGDDDKFVIVTIPNYSYSQGLYPKVLNLFVAGNEPDVTGRKYYRIRLEDSVIYREVGFWEYTKAFAKDFTLFPVQLYMFLNWH